MEIFVKFGPGICNECGEIVFHLEIFEEGNHPVKRVTICPVCTKDGKISE